MRAKQLSHETQGVFSWSGRAACCVRASLSPTRLPIDAGQTSPLMMADPLIGETTDVYFSGWATTTNEARAWENGWVQEQAESNFTTEPFLDRWVGTSSASWQGDTVDSERMTYTYLYSYHILVFENSCFLFRSSLLRPTPYIGAAGSYLLDRCVKVNRESTKLAYHTRQIGGVPRIYRNPTPTLRRQHKDLDDRAGTEARMHQTYSWTIIERLRIFNMQCTR